MRSWIYLFLLCYAPFLIAQEITLDANSQKKFADRLHLSKEFYRAITEYQRLLHFFPKQQSPEIHTQIAKSYLAGRDYNGAIDYFKSVKVKYPELLWSEEMQFLYSLAFLDKDNHKPFYYRRDNIKKAITLMYDIRVDFYKPVKSFVDEWQQHNQQSKKSPLIAGSLSAILPGAGSLYNKRYKEAFYSFFINSLFVLASIEARNNKESTKEAIFSFFALAFYGGNIYTAINGAHKYNDYTKTKYLNDLRIKYSINLTY